MKELIKTGDGSYTIYNSELDETYHSVNGAMTESLHVFIKNGLLYKNFEKKAIHIIEVGFGTGLNALLSIEHRPLDKTIYYVAVEPSPFTLSDSQKYFELFETKPQKMELLETMLKDCTKGFVEISNDFYFHLKIAPIQEITELISKELFNKIDVKFTGYDIVYFDAFAPQKQAEMWTLESLKNITSQMASQGLFTTYCAQGEFKRNLKALGLDIHRIEGPPGKREMTIGLI